MTTTPRLGWNIPSAYEEEWSNKMTSALYSMDAASYASSENDNLFFMGGGNLLFDAGTDSLSWSSDIEITTSTSRYLIVIEAASTTLLDNQWLYMIMPRQLRQQTIVSFVVASGYILASGSNVHDYIAIARRRGTRLYFRNGIMLEDGQSAPIFSMPISSSAVAHQHIDQYFTLSGGETTVVLSHVAPQLTSIHFHRNGLRGAAGFDYTVDLNSGIVTFSPPGPVGISGERINVEKILLV